MIKYYKFGQLIYTAYCGLVGFLYLCIDEVALSREELYTVLMNKEAHGGKVVLSLSLRVRMSVLSPLSCLSYPVVAVTKCVR